MDNLNNDFYEENWNELTPVTVKTEHSAEDYTDSSETDSVKRRTDKKISSPVLTIQLVLCLILLTVLFLFKTFSYDLYSVFRNWYDSEVKATLYFSGDFSQLDYTTLFSSTDDEV